MHNRGCNWDCTVFERLLNILQSIGSQGHVQVSAGNSGASKFGPNLRSNSFSSQVTELMTSKFRIVLILALCTLAVINLVCSNSDFGFLTYSD